MNKQLPLAKNFALHTAEHLFITGNAGTGKTTLLKEIVKETYKKTLVAAPTGVAAINAGGVTIHSLFHLPVTSFIPAYDSCDPQLFSNRYMLLRQLRLPKEKIKLIRQVELLIIDEASMVRSDVLDAIDFVLQTIRKIKKPFGGVQIMMIGDLFQLPPVVKEQEWNQLQAYYRSPYFFDSLVWQQAAAVHIELKEVFRQQDEQFIRLLNNIRHGRMGSLDFKLVEERYQPYFENEDEKYILLTTHNYKADRINEEKLRKTDAELITYEARLDGDFPENMYPCDRILQLKEGARVMFIKNDIAEGQYFNGLTGTVTSASSDKLWVRTDCGSEIEVRRRTWENVRYRSDGTNAGIIKEPIGTFLQYPLKLAWAVTIHKSQGLTFDRVIVDAGASFAPGQVYVALSRCRSLEGMVLMSGIHQEALLTDKRILDFSEQQLNQTGLDKRLEESQILYTTAYLMSVFSVDKLRSELDEWFELLSDHKAPLNEKVIKLYHETASAIAELKEVEQKFKSQIEKLFPLAFKDNHYEALLKERCVKAIEYFTNQICNQVILPFSKGINELTHSARTKKHLKAALEFTGYCRSYLESHFEIRFMGEKIYSKGIPDLKTDLIALETKPAKHKKKGNSLNGTLLLYNQKRSIAEIAEIRGLTRSTVKGHLTQLIRQNKADIFDVLSKNKIAAICSAIEKTPGSRLADVRSNLSKEIDLNDIRMVMSWLETNKITG
ncbi:MAG: AAA family ATPase [Bacteroidia bacterium]|nr:AAA family ATPase [Bacteroidia bacterium]MCZ2278156.1 AAA family ATPase [Bacteroidia bacterium]